MKKWLKIKWFSRRLEREYAIVVSMSHHPAGKGKNNG